MNLKIIYPICIAVTISCQDSPDKKDLNRIGNSTELGTNATKNDSLTNDVQISDSTNQSATNEDSVIISVLALPCSNGYDFATSNFDFVPFVSSELTKYKGISVLPFPFKRLKHTAYYGVYDKRYCRPIIDKVNADYILMTKFSEPHPDAIGNDTVKWGYEIKILNTKTMHQIISIGKKDLKDYKAIERNILENMNTLVNDLRSLK